MDADLSRKVIEAAGGAMPFARLLGIDHTPYVSSRVSNWRRRGIPAEVRADHPELIRDLVAKVVQSEQAAQTSGPLLPSSTAAGE